MGTFVIEVLVQFGTTWQCPIFLSLSYNPSTLMYTQENNIGIAYTIGRGQDLLRGRLRGVLRARQQRLCRHLRGQAQHRQVLRRDWRDRPQQPRQEQRLQEDQDLRLSGADNKKSGIFRISRIIIRIFTNSVFEILWNVKWLANFSSIWYFPLLIFSATKFPTIFISKMIFHDFHFNDLTIFNISNAIFSLSAKFSEKEQLIFLWKAFSKLSSSIQSPTTGI